MQKLPEVFYTRLADDALGDSSPGLLTWHSEYRASRLRMEFTEPTARQLGYTNNFRARRAFGVAADESIADRLRSEGFTETDVHRLDTRHELSAQLEAGPVNITPFAVGRLTFYDNRFEDFSPDERDRVRAFGAVGTRFWTSIQRIDDTVESRLFDLHRMRHIVEPSATVWHAGSTIDRADLPVYDEDVESLATGSAVRFGIDQTWQTQRGGPGRWRSVDVFTLSTHMVFASADADRRSTLGRFFEDRPELSILGDFATADATWQVSDMLALVGGTLYSFDLDQPARTTAGFVLRHTPELVSTAEIRYLNAHDTTFYNIGSRYTLTDKYTLGANATFDGDRARFQAAGADLRRRFPNVVVGLNMHYNDIANNASFGFSFEPVGVEDRAARLRGLGTVNERARQTAIGG